MIPLEKIIKLIAITLGTVAILWGAVVVYTVSRELNDFKNDLFSYNYGYNE